MQRQGPGATDEELTEVAFCVCCSVGKAKLQESGACLRKVFESPTFKAILSLAEERTSH